MSCDSTNESNDGTQHDSEESMKEEKDGGKPDIRDLMVEILTNLGCQPTKEENDSVYVSYQGGRLHMIFDGMDVIIWEPFWCRIKVDDPNLPIAQKAVNAANFISGPAVVMTAPDEEGFIIFRSRRDIMLHPTCPDNESFVRTVLESFFKKKIDVYRYYQKFVAEQREPQENCRKSDFTKDMNPN